MYAVEIDGLTYTYPGAPQPTLRDISLQIPKGDFLAVVGNNGCGKSTLFLHHRHSVDLLIDNIFASAAALSSFCIALSLLSATFRANPGMSPKQKKDLPKNRRAFGRS